VKQAMPSSTQPHAFAVSPAQLAESVCAAQGFAGGGGAVPPQSQGGQDVPAWQAGHAHGVAVPVLEPEALPEGTVIVVVAPALHAQLHGAHAAPAGHTGQLQVQVPEPPALPLPSPQAPPVPGDPPPPEPPVPPPQPQSQGGHKAPGPHAGQAQVQVPPPPGPGPASVEGGGGAQSHLTGGHGPFAGQTRGWTQRQPLLEAPAAKQYPPPPQL
jgi:hypothetical protein